MEHNRHSVLGTYEYFILFFQYKIENENKVSNDASYSI